MIVTPYDNAERDPDKQGRAVLHYQGNKPKEEPPTMETGPREIKIEEEDESLKINEESDKDDSI